MKVYISGKITGDADYKKKFANAEEMARAVGFEVFNPARVPDEGKPWEWYMKRDIKELMDCDAILLLKDWEESKGARLEAYIASQLKIKIYEEK